MCRIQLWIARAQAQVVFDEYFQNYIDKSQNQLLQWMIFFFGW